MTMAHVPASQLPGWHLAELQAAARKQGGQCLSSSYVTARHKLEFKCADPAHAPWWALPQHIRNGHWCPTCRADRLARDHTGKKFGLLVAQQRLGRSRSVSQSSWICVCACGNTVTVRTSNLTSGRTRSCGCLKPKNMLPVGCAAANALFRSYVNTAKRRGLTFGLPKAVFLQLTTERCHYCGAQPANGGATRYNGNYVYNGIDRVNPDLGYEEDNVVPCCRVCNRAKGDLSKEEFVDWISHLREHDRRRNPDGNLSRLPSYDPQHVCGMFCDGQDGSSSKCAQEKRAGGPLPGAPAAGGSPGDEELVDELIQVASRRTPTASFVDWSTQIVQLRAELLRRLRLRRV